MACKGSAVRIRYAPLFFPSLPGRLHPSRTEPDAGDADSRIAQPHGGAARSPHSTLAAAQTSQSLPYSNRGSRGFPDHWTLCRPGVDAESTPDPANRENSASATGLIRFGEARCRARSLTDPPERRQVVAPIERRQRTLATCDLPAKARTISASSRESARPRNRLHRGRASLE